MIHEYGLHRVIGEKVLPQMAQKISAELPIHSSEMLIEVETLNIDSASFHQLIEAHGRDLKKVEIAILDIVNARGKMQNPVTNSGGMLIGTVKEVGADFKKKAFVGQKIATLVSLTLTPLKIEKIIKIIPEKEQIIIQGHAILFSSGIFAELPKDYSSACALSLLDVCGAPAQTKNLVKTGMKMAILGAGKSGFLCALAAYDILKKSDDITIFDYSEKALEHVQSFGMGFKTQQMNATNPMEAIDFVAKNGQFDLVINVTNVMNCEMNAILMTKDHGITYFFSMATSFTKAALGAEGVGKDVQMLIGNGYCVNHADYTFTLINNYPKIKKYYEDKYGN
ncbi:MAG: L-erythro-3,5-diaminohexanoate dehydrogenase [Bacteriovoracaceae bacterium]